MKGQSSQSYYGERRGNWQGLTARSWFLAALKVDPNLFHQWRVVSERGWGRMPYGHSPHQVLALIATP
jgi:hypothetical protein